MAKARAIITPRLDCGAPVELSDGSGLRFRKMILPVGRGIDYRMPNGKTRRLDFTPEYIAELAASFDSGAYPDGVPFQLAGPDNAHTMDPERQRGDVVGLTAEPGKGLYADIEFHTPEAAAMVRNNPRLGVSAQIIENLVKPTGERFGKAIRHVLGTLNPRVEGMTPWEPVVSLSDEVREDRIIDLSHQSFSEDTNMGKRKGSSKAADTLDLSDDVDEWTEEQVDEFLDSHADLGHEGDDTDLSDTPTGTVNLVGDDVQRQVDLAVAEQRDRLDRLEAENAATRWDQERTTYLSEGVPPAILDLCDDVMSLPDHIVQESVDLSVTDENGRPAPFNFRGFVTDLLGEYKGMVDLSETVGHGGHHPDESSSENEDIDKAWAAQRGETVGA